MNAEKEKLIALTAKLKAEGFADVRYYIEHTHKFTLNVMNGEKEKSTRSNEQLYFAEAGKDGKRCCTFFNNLECPEEIVEQMQVSAVAASQDYHPIPLFAEEKSYAEEFVPVDEPEVIETLAKTEAVMYEEKKIANVDKCSCTQSTKETILMDENGTTLSDSQGTTCVAVSVVSREDGDTEIAGGGRSAVALKDIDAIALGREVAEKGAQRLHAKPIPSGKYKVILKNNAAAELLNAYIPIFYASNMQTKMSKLAGRQGETIAIEDINLVEDPQLKNGRVHRHFDDEGTPVSHKYLIHEGKFESSLYNRSSAEKEGKSSSGNGFKANIRSEVGTSVTNIALQSVSGNNISFEELYQKMGTGLIVTNLEGVFAGANSTTGAFSLLCKGMMVEDGKLTKPFCEITIAGNIYDLLKEIVAMGDDVVPTREGSRYLETPSLLLKGLAVSGL